MFATKEKPRTLNTLDKDKRIAIAEYILDYVKRNPRKQIPNGKIAELCNTPAYNIGTITKQLVRTGQIKQVSRYTYEINERPTALPPVQHPMPVQTSLGETQGIGQQVEALAKEYVWLEGVPPAPLQDFIEWLKQR